MATGKITKTAVDGLAPGASDRFLWDIETKGFGVKVTPSGLKSYIFQYRTGGRGSPTRRYTIGRHGPFTPQAAEKEAKRLSASVSDGKDPASDRKDAKTIAIVLSLAAAVSAMRPAGGHQSCLLSKGSKLMASSKQLKKLATPAKSERQLPAVKAAKEPAKPSAKPYRTIIAVDGKVTVEETAESVAEFEQAFGSELPDYQIHTLGQVLNVIMTGPDLTVQVTPR